MASGSLWQIEHIPAHLRKFFEPAFEEKERSTQGRDVVNVIDRKDGRGPVPVNARIQPARNPHPTVKPIALCRWLATLLLPPPEYAPRRILVPFAGSGSEMIAAMLAGWEEIVGVELKQEYVDIAEARLAHWARQPRQEGLWTGDKQGDI